MDPTVKALLFSMFVLLGLFLLVFPESERLGLVGGAIFLVAIAWFGRLISRSEEAEIARALTELLEAPAA